MGSERGMRMNGLMIAATASVICLVGCIKPSEEQPWSTKSASLPKSSATQARPMSPAPEAPAPGDDELVLLVPLDDGEPEEQSRAARSADAGDAERTPPEVTEVVVAPAPPAILRGGTPQDRARSIVEIAVESANALERAYAFEAMQSMPDMLLEHGGRGVVDENRGVRFVATMAIGRAGLGRLASVLSPGLFDDSDSVRAATIFALRSLGEGVDPSPLALMVESDDPEIRGNATMVLGMLGNPSAVPLIQSSLGRGMRLRNPMRVRITELQAAEALVELGREEDIEPIRAALFAPVEQGEITVLACDMLGRLEDEQARPMLMRLLLAEGNQRRPPEIRVAAAGAIFQLPPPHEPGLEQVLLEQVKAEDPRLRTQVAAALRHAPGEASEKALDRLLADSDPLVRIAAAGALLGRWGAMEATAVAAPD